MTTSDAIQQALVHQAVTIQLAIVHEAECWCPGCGAATTERFIELLIWLERTDRPTFDRAIKNIVNDIHTYEGEKAA